MANYTPTTHHVFNEFDQQGIFLGLERLRNEDNATYKQRLLDVMTNKASSAYRGLINGITRELGLEFYDAISVECLTDSNGDYLLTNPSVTFDGNMCYLVSNVDPSNYTIYYEIDRYNLITSTRSITGLVDAINATPYFNATILDNTKSWERSTQIFNQSSTLTVTNEDIALGSTQIKLENNKLIRGTVAVTSANLRERVSSLAALLHTGQYYINLNDGIVHTIEAPVAGSSIRYMCIRSPMIFKASPVIVHNLAMDPFRKKMFQQILDRLGNIHNGEPSLLGYNLINELYSVTPLYWAE